MTDLTMGGDSFENARTVARQPLRRRITDSVVPHVVDFDSTPPDPPAPILPPEDEELHFLFDHSHELICIATSDGFFTKVNPAFERVLGWTTRQLRSKPFLDFVHPEDRERTLASMEALRHGQAVRRFENRYLAADGQYRILSWNASPRGDKIFAVARDVTVPTGETDLQRQIHQSLETYFESGGGSGSFGGATDTAKNWVTWLKWIGAIISVVFMAGVGYQQFFTENATKKDLEAHVTNDLSPVKDTLVEVKTSVDTLVVADAKRLAEDQRKYEHERKLRRLEAYRAEYQEALAEYTASKASGKRATRPRTTQAHMDLEAELSGP